MNQIESADRLVRFFDANWVPVGHTFTYFPEAAGERELTISVPSDVSNLAKSNILGGLNVALDEPRTTWRVTRLSDSGAAIYLTMVNFAEYLHSMIMPSNLYLSQSKTLGVDYFI